MTLDHSSPANEDSANGEFNPKRFIVVKPEEQPREYKS